MNKYIIKIIPKYKEILKAYGNIYFESQLIKGLIELESELSIDELWEIPHVLMLKIIE